MNVNAIDFAAEDPLLIHLNPIVLLGKLLHGLSKILYTRGQTEDACKAVTFASEAYATAVGEKQTLHRARMCIELSNQYMGAIDMNGLTRYDSDDRPLAFAFEAESIITKIIADDSNYWKAAVKAHLGKVYLEKSEVQKASAVFDVAKEMIVEAYGAEAPLYVKFHQFDVDVLNRRDQSDERDKNILKICEENVSCLEKVFGAESIYLMRFLYLLFTAKIHEDGDGYLDVLEKMTRLQVEGQVVETN